MSTKRTLHTVSSVFYDSGTRFSVVILMNFRLQNVCLADEQVRWDNLFECSCIWKERVSKYGEMWCQCNGKKQNLLTYLLTCLLTYLLTCLLTYLLTYILTYLLAYLVTYLLTYLLAYLLTWLLTYLLTYLLAYLLAYLLTCLLNYLLTCLLIACLLNYLLT